MKKITITLLLISCAGFITALEPFDYEIYPQGWSRDGLFAYVIYKGSLDGYGPVTDFCFYIQDLVTDDILFSQKYYELDVSYSPDEVIAMFPVINNAIKENNIIKDVAFQEYNKTFTFLQTDYELLINTESQDNDTSIAGFSILHIEVIYAKPANNTKKTIYQNNNPGNAVSCNARIFKSPFESRTAVVIYIGSPGWEGIPLETQIVVIGSNLLVGFD